MFLAAEMLKYSLPFAGTTIPFDHLLRLSQWVHQPTSDGCFVTFDAFPPERCRRRGGRIARGVSLSLFVYVCVACVLPTARLMDARWLGLVRITMAL